MNEPGYWMQETSGVLQPAVIRYLQRDPLDLFDIAALRAYLRQWIAGDHWQGPEIAGLRDMVDSLNSRAQIERWIDRAKDCGIDPL